MVGYSTQNQTGLHWASDVDTSWIDIVNEADGSYPNYQGSVGMKWSSTSPNEEMILIQNLHLLGTRGH